MLILFSSHCESPGDSSCLYLHSASSTRCLIVIRSPHALQCKVHSLSAKSMTSIADIDSLGMRFCSRSYRICLSFKSHNVHKFPWPVLVSSFCLILKKSKISLLIVRMYDPIRSSILLRYFLMLSKYQLSCKPALP